MISKLKINSNVFYKYAIAFIEINYFKKKLGKNLNFKINLYISWKATGRRIWYIKLSTEPISLFQ